MSLRGAFNFVRRQHADARAEAQAPDLTAAAIAQDVRRARDRVHTLRQRLARAERELAQREWELEVYASHGTIPKRPGLAKRVAEMAERQRRHAIRIASPSPPGSTGAG
jgi:hypothetical protein